MRFEPRRSGRLRAILWLLVCCGAVSVCAASTTAGAASTTAGAASATDAAPATDTEPPRAQPLIRLSPGDTVAITVFEQPDLNATLYVGDDGAVPVALAGPVHVGGLTPAAAGDAIAKALRDGKFLVNPHVTVTVVNAFNQHVSVLGEVVKPGRYDIDSRTTILDLLAQAGGTKDTSSETAYIVHTRSDGTTVREPIDLAGLRSGRTIESAAALRGGDVLLIPPAEKYYVYGEVMKTGEYRLEHDTTVLQAIVQAGGITVRGSMHRVAIIRKGPDGKSITVKPKLSDPVHPGDEIRVKESIF